MTPRGYAAEQAHWEASLAAHRHGIERATDERQRARARGNAARVLGHLGFIADRRGNRALAASLHQQSLALKRLIADALGTGLTLLALGALEHKRGDRTSAEEAYGQCLEVARVLRDGWLVSEALDGLSVLRARKDPVRALRLAGAAGVLRDALANHDAPDTRALRVARLAPAIHALPTEARTQALAAGAGLSLEEAVSEALGQPFQNGDRPSPRIADWASGSFNRRAARAALSPWYGRLVDVGGYRLYVRCLGEGGPAVVLNAGLGSSWQAWEAVAPALARNTTVVAYSRAGLRDSEPGPLPRTAQLVCDDLRALLRAAGISPPYVLVGHSYGGMVLRLYASQHPRKWPAWC